MVRTRIEPPKLTPRGVWQGFRSLTPVALFALPGGAAFGVVAAEQGADPVAAISMSALIFSGAAQFVMVEFLGDDRSMWMLAVLTLAISARHIVMGAAVAPWINQLPIWKRMCVLAWLSDPNFAVAQPAIRTGGVDLGRLLGGGLSLWVYWIIGTAIGASGGRLVNDVEAYGLDVAMPAFFATVVAGGLRNGAAPTPMILAGGIALLTAAMLPPGLNILAAAVAGGLWLAARRGR